MRRFRSRCASGTDKNLSTKLLSRPPAKLFIACNTGGTTMISLRSHCAYASRAAIHSPVSNSESSVTRGSCFAGQLTRKNHVSNLLGANGGGTQRAKIGKAHV